MSAFFDEMFADMGAVFTELWGEPYALTLRDGRELDGIDGIYKPAHAYVPVGGRGVESITDLATLTFRRAQLLAAGVMELGAELDGAATVVNGRPCVISSPDDDYGVMIRFELQDG